MIVQRPATCYDNEKIGRVVVLFVGFRELIGKHYRFKYCRFADMSFAGLKKQFNKANQVSCLWCCCAIIDNVTRSNGRN